MTTFSPLANHLWQTTIFAGAVAALAFAVRQNRARVRYALWLTHQSNF